MHTTTDTTLLEKAADTLPERITRAVERKISKCNVAARTVAYHRVGLDRRNSIIDFILTFATNDEDAEYTAIVEVRINADGTPDGILVTMYDNFDDDDTTDGTIEGIRATTVDESVDMAATIIVNLLRSVAAAK